MRGAAFEIDIHSWLRRWKAPRSHRLRTTASRADLQVTVNETAPKLSSSFPLPLLEQLIRDKGTPDAHKASVQALTDRNAARFGSQEGDCRPGDFDRSEKVHAG